MRKIAIVNQRYGLEVNGGSEYYTKLIAEHLNNKYDVEILTTTALNYDTWENYYPTGKTHVNGVSVLRFPVKTQRNMLRFRIINKLTKYLKKIGIHLDKLWVKQQGPNTPELINYIKNSKNKYDVFIFITYLYYPTAIGLSHVAEKSILIPTAHDEPYIHYKIYQKVFHYPCGIIFLTEEEKEFVHQKFKNSSIMNDVIGVGIDVSIELMDKKNRKFQIEKFRNKYGITSEYIIYVGRVDYGKKCDEMFTFFHKFKSSNPDNKLKLVVIGKDMMGVPKDKDIHFLGFVSEEAKYAGIAGARFLWLPSEFESLSIALLEGMALGIPGIVNGKCQVLKGHCLKSKGAVYYTDEKEFMQNMGKLTLLSSEQYNCISDKAEKYVKENYCWDKVEKKLFDFIELNVGKDKLI